MRIAFKLLPQLLCRVFKLSPVGIVFSGEFLFGFFWFGRGFIGVVDWCSIFHKQGWRSAKVVRKVSGPFSFGWRRAFVNLINFTADFLHQFFIGCISHPLPVALRQEDDLLFFILPFGKGNKNIVSFRFDKKQPGRAAVLKGYGEIHAGRFV